MEKIRNAATQANLIASTILIVSIIGVIISIAVMILGITNPNIIENLYNSSNNMTASLTLGNLDMTLNSLDSLPDNLSKTISINAIPELIQLLTVASICFFFKKLIKPMRDGITPFIAGNHYNMYCIGWITLVGSVAFAWARELCIAATLNEIDFENFFNTDLIESVTISYDVVSAPIITSFIIFLLAYIFKYGETLQKESDETL